MRNLFLLLLLFVSTGHLSAQCGASIVEESFETPVMPPGGSLIYVQDGNPNSNWCGSHGKAYYNNLYRCDGSQAITIPMQRYNDGSGTPDSWINQGAGVLYNFDDPIPAGTYEFSFCFCVNDETLPGDGTPGNNVTVSLTNGHPCNIANDFFEPVPLDVGGDEVIFNENFNPEQTYSCDQGMVTITRSFETAQAFDKLWIHGSQINGGSINSSAGSKLHFDGVTLESLETTFDCAVESDLTACADEGDYGYIALSCPGTYEWSFPAGSEALEYSSSNHSVIVNAGEGTYSVTITDSDGCIDTRSFTIEADCCPAPPCDLPAPHKLGCGINDAGIRLTWNDVAGASGYLVTLDYSGVSGGCCEGDEPKIETIFRPATKPFYQLTAIDLCLSWSVQTICKDGGLSEPSPFICLRDMECRKLPKARAGEGTSSLNANAEKIKIAPNPTQDIVYITNPTAADLNVQVFASNGQVVAQDFIAANANTSLTLEHLTAGLYYVQFEARDSKAILATQRLVINR